MICNCNDEFRTTELKFHTGLQSQFSFWPCTTWFETVYFLQMSLSNRLLSPGMRRNSASILWTWEELQGGKKQFNSVQTKNSSSALMVGKSTWFLWRPIRRTQSTYSTSTLYIISWTIFMDWGSRCLRGLVARELSSDDSVGEERKKTTEKQKKHVQMYY